MRILLLIILLTFFATTCSANLLVNGDLTGEIPATNGTHTPSVPPGWYATTASIDMWDSGAVGHFGEQYPESPGGTQFVAAVGSTGGVHSADSYEGFAQSIDGLIIGQDYVLSFQQANLGIAMYPINGYVSSGFWRVSLNEQSYDSPVMPFLGFGADNFYAFSIPFVADSEELTVEFASYDDLIGGSVWSYLAIDDISLVEVPEPSCLSLAVATSLFFCTRRR